MSGIMTKILPPGFRFHPTDEELVTYYLKQKVSPSPNQLMISIVADVNIYKFNPWELPDKAFFGEEEWFFFSPRDKKYPNGTRPNRAAASGYWKATGTDKPIITSVGSQCLGMKKALVFYKGRPPKGEKTDWMMTEYRLLDDYFPSPRPTGSMRLDDWVLCRVRQKSSKVGGRNFDSSSSCSPPLVRGYLQGQDQMIVENYVTIDLHHSNNNIYELAPEFQMVPLESEELDEKGGQMMEFQESSPDYSSSFSLTPTSSSNPQTTIHSGLRDVLKSIERVLSVGALDEQILLSSQPAEKMSDSNSSTNNNNNKGKASIFEIASPPHHFSSEF